MNDKQKIEIIDALLKIANELEELNKNISYLQSCANLTVGEVRSVKEPRARYYELR